MRRGYKRRLEPSALRSSHFCFASYGSRHGSFESNHVRDGIHSYRIALPSRAMTMGQKLSTSTIPAPSSKLFTIRSSIWQPITSKFLLMTLVGNLAQLEYKHDSVFAFDGCLLIIPVLHGSRWLRHVYSHAQDLTMAVLRSQRRRACRCASLRQRVAICRRHRLELNGSLLA